jgi:PDZ domain-containing protein
MFNKVYEKVLEYIKEEYKFLIIMLILLVTMTYKLPYYVDTPGGIINISERINIDNKKLKGTMNFAYVSEMNATIPTYLISKINKDWDLIKKEEVVYENETEEEAKFRDQLSLKEALSNALYVGFKESNEEFKIKNNKVYVTKKLKEAKTNLKVGDQIIEVDGIKINNIKELQNLENKQEGKTIKIKVKNNKKEYERTAEYIKLEDKLIIGIALGETFEIDSNHEIDIDYKARESGPSGGMMMALTTYSYLTGEDLTKGKTIVGTGTIDKDGNVGSIGGVKYKLIGAVKNKADIFLVPNGENYDEAIKIKKQKNYNIKIVGISNIKDAINELKNN